jgi:hypothetical protein
LRVISQNIDGKISYRRINHLQGIVSSIAIKKIISGIFIRHNRNISTRRENENATGGFSYTSQIGWKANPMAFHGMLFFVLHSPGLQGSNLANSLRWN